MAPTLTTVQAPPEYLLHLADNALVLGQRNAEWCGHGPIIEEDIAMANISLDLIGQARLLYSHAATGAQDPAVAALLPRQGPAVARGLPLAEDDLAYFRDAPQFRNYQLLELPHRLALVPGVAGDRDYAVTIVRNYLYSSLMLSVWGQLQAAADATLAGIAAKCIKETRYHLRHSTDWLIRMGDGTPLSKAKAQAALDHLMPYTQEFWTDSGMEQSARAVACGVDMAAVRAPWQAQLETVLAEATLELPAAGGFVSSGKTGLHSEHLGYLLGEMQSLARAHPAANW